MSSPRAVITGLGQWPDPYVDGTNVQHRIRTRREAETHASFESEFLYGAADLPDVAKELGLSRVDRRSLGTQFYLGVYAAGLALKSADVLGSERTGSIGLSVALKGCERDQKLDTEITRRAASARAYDAAQTNRMLMENLRPSLFLSQITNLLAANLAVLFSTLGTSRTFVGEEQAGCSALENAIRRAAGSTPESTLAGAALNADSYGLLSWFASLQLSGSSNENTNVWLRTAGACPSTIASFLVIEPQSPLRALPRQSTSIKLLLRSSWTASGRSYSDTLQELENVLEIESLDPRRTAIISNTQGTPLTSTEREFWGKRAQHYGLLISNAGIVGSALEVDVFSAVNTAVRLLHEDRTQWPDLTHALHPTQNDVDICDLNAAVVVCSGLFDGLSAFLLERI